MKYKAVIFDLFGTLVDSYSVQGYNKLLADMASALQLPENDFSQFWRDTTYERGTGIFKTTGESIRYISKMLESPISEENIEKCDQIRRETTRRALTPKHGAITILETLRGLGHKIGLITNCSAEVPLIWQDTEFSSQFDVTIFSASVGMKKPNPHIYTMVCEQLGVDPSDCLYIGDGDSNELTGASEVGMDAIMIRDPNEKDPYRLVEVVWYGRKIEKFSEILNLI